MAPFSSTIFYSSFRAGWKTNIILLHLNTQRHLIFHPGQDAGGVRRPRFSQGPAILCSATVGEGCTHGEDNNTIGPMPEDWIPSESTHAALLKPPYSP